ncbi:testis-specific serine/threonine-protein kinase 4 [Sitodiplosis mosellana]|uniref:testis-specific serine/threonine-protein kinase 4 n=1 Tax=Sitodiplosis mosellana TaxID=263140 RepID=UPI0024451EB4|nr:testis-specific serine/threonine-protein kinase 4 [Sitodiplosis mosellana]
MLFQKKFLPREINIVKTLRHPNIVQYFQCIETNRRFIIAMEYAQTGSLLDLMAMKHVLSETEARVFFRQLIGALQFCHSKFIAHRDLKLENLLLFWENCLKIGDFGFARHFDVDDGSTTFSSTFCGSNAYISPEILHQRSYNPLSADIWACGVILFAMVFGKLPFDDSGSIQHLTQNYFLQLVDKGLVFPIDKKISVECKNLITNVMTPESMRPKIRSILNDPWISSNLEK